MPGQHKHPPIPFRPPEADRTWLLAHAKATGKAVNAILAAALFEYRIRHEAAVRRSHPGREPEGGSGNEKGDRNS